MSKICLLCDLSSAWLSIFCTLTSFYKLLPSWMYLCALAFVVSILSPLHPNSFLPGPLHYVFLLISVLICFGFLQIIPQITFIFIFWTFVVFLSIEFPFLEGFFVFVSFFHFFLLCRAFLWGFYVHVWDLEDVLQWPWFASLLLLLSFSIALPLVSAVFWW